MIRPALRWLTRPYWSRLDGAVLAALGMLVGLHPHWLVTEAACVAVVMLGVRAPSLILARFARTQKAAPGTTRR